MANLEGLSKYHRESWNSLGPHEDMENDDINSLKTPNRDLTKRLAIDTATAFTAALSAAPVMAVIDQGITEAASGRTSLVQSMRHSLVLLVHHPSRFIVRRTFAAMVLLYTGTYVTANFVDTLSSYSNGATASAIASGWTKFCAVSCVNMSLAVNKDRVFARAFGTIAPRQLTMGSYVPFIIRDGMTIGAAFNLPPLIARSLPESFDAFISRLLLAQLFAPACMQLFNTPLHLVGLDVYNRGPQISWRTRMAFVRCAWPSTSAARMCRVFAAFGIGGVVNTRVRTKLMKTLDEPMLG